MKVNYHTHTPRCNHAVGSEIEYVNEAVNYKFDTLGFSDHCPWNNITNPRVGLMRMDLSQLDDYIYQVSMLKEQFSNKLKIKLGFEVEYFPNRIQWMKQLVKEKGIEYLILGLHFIEYEDNQFSNYFGKSCTEKELDDYLNTALEAMDSGIFTYMAHPDLYVKGYGKFNDKAKEVCRQICKKAKDIDMALGFNLNGYQHFRDKDVYGYPYNGFWEIASEYGVKVLVEYDAHNPLLLTREDLYQEATDLLTDMGCNVVDNVELKKIY